MAVTNPPIALQNLATHTAQLLRVATTTDQSAPRTGSSLVPRGGVHPFLGSAMAVSQQGSPTMGVTVQAGIATVPGTEAASQGAYTCLSASAENVTIAAAHASLPRIDLIVAKVEDAAFSGAVNAWSLAAVTGTAAGSPVAPTAPNNSITLAQVAVGAAVTQILNANITDRRIFSSTGIISCTSTTRPNPALTNMVIVESDTGDILRYNGSSWTVPYAQNWTNWTPTIYQNMATAPSAVGGSVSYARYRKVGTTVHVLWNVLVTPVTTGGVGISLPFPQAQRFQGMGVGGIWGGGTPADQTGWMYGMPSPHLDKIVVTAYTGAFRDTTAASQAYRGAGTYETT